LFKDVYEIEQLSPRADTAAVQDVAPSASD